MKEARDWICKYLADDEPTRRASVTIETDDPAIDEGEKAVRALFQKGVCYNVSTLAVGGADLIAAGIPGGPAVGKILQALTSRVIAGDLTNDPALLLRAARELHAHSSD